MGKKEKVDTLLPCRICYKADQIHTIDKEWCGEDSVVGCSRCSATVKAANYRTALANWDTWAR